MAHFSELTKATPLQIPSCVILLSSWLMFVFTFFDAANGLIYLAAFSGLGGRQEGHPACKKLSGGVLERVSCLMLQ